MDDPIEKAINLLRRVRWVFVVIFACGILFSYQFFIVDSIFYLIGSLVMAGTGAYTFLSSSRIIRQWDVQQKHQHDRLEKWRADNKVK